ncbi:MAG: helix-turn-helix domain-containing protein, partial [Ignavibacteria bacterium]|nr:helix-turn-helix domain-containing protein [Ignavibacteria bacterium]
KGEITIDKLVSAEKVALIREYFIETEDMHLGPAKEVLGDAVTYGELRLVLNQLFAEGALQNFNTYSDDNQ